MLITPTDQYKMEELMLNEAIKRGATSLNDWITGARQAIKEGKIPTPVKSEAVLIFSYLIQGEALKYLCDVIYKYADDTHMETFQKRLFARHAG
jgi:hypothetical protein